MPKAVERIKRRLPKPVGKVMTRPRNRKVR